MTDFTVLSNRDFVSQLASKEAVPGGGGASALIGALGIALGNMVGNLTVGKKKYATIEPDILVLMQKAGKIQEELMMMMNQDAEAFKPLSMAYGMPEDTPSQKELKKATMEKALYTAAQTPLAIMQLCGSALKLMLAFEEKGSKIAISDVGVGAAALRASLTGAAMNVAINTKSMVDRTKADEINSTAAALIDKYVPIADGIVERITKELDKTP